MALFIAILTLAFAALSGVLYLLFSDLARRAADRLLPGDRP